MASAARRWRRRRSSDLANPVEGRLILPRRCLGPRAGRRIPPRRRHPPRTGCRIPPRRRHPPRAGCRIPPRSCHTPASAGAMLVPTPLPPASMSEMMDLLLHVPVLPVSSAIPLPLSSLSYLGFNFSVSSHGFKSEMLPLRKGEAEA